MFFLFFRFEKKFFPHVLPTARHHNRWTGSHVEARQHANHNLIDYLGKSVQDINEFEYKEIKVTHVTVRLALLVV